MFRVFKVIGVFWAIFFTYAGLIHVVALQQPDYAHFQKEESATQRKPLEIQDSLPEEPFAAPESPVVRDPHRKKSPPIQDLPLEEPFAVQKSLIGKNYSDLQPKPKISKISECDKRTQNAWSRFNHIVGKFSCRRGDNEYQLLEALLREHPTLLWAVDNRGHSLLILAILFRRADVVALLLFTGCALETRDAQGNTPLLSAIGERFIAAVVLLLTYGADPEARNNDGFNALQLAFAMDSTMGAVVLKYSPAHH